MDKSYFMHFVSSVRWHCTILMNTTRLNEDLDRAVRGVCDLQLEWRQNAWQDRCFIRASEWENWQFRWINSANREIWRIGRG